MTSTKPGQRKLHILQALAEMHRFAKSGFKHNPAEDSALHIALLLAARDSA